MDYAKSKDGHHYYKKLKNGYLHVSVFHSDTTIVTRSEYLEMRSDHSAGDCCINNVDEISFDTEECSVELFESKLKFAIYQLEIHDYWNPL